MLSKFTEFVKQNHLFDASAKILLALSGGVDSMVLFDLFRKAKVNFSVVHCNFKLRGQESDGDEEFVINYANEIGIPVFVKSFETQEYAKLNSISVEMAARELRYCYFNEILQEYDFDFIATAHHQDDLIETFFINLIRKTGIKGLTGIKTTSGNLIRPLLFANREMICNYALKENISFREDSSNTSAVHKRNFIRHKILPLFEEVNPSYRNNILESIENLKEAEEVYQHSIKGYKKGLLDFDGRNPEIDINKLLETPYPKILLFEILNDYSFNPVVINEIWQGITDESGKQYFSSTHRVVRDRRKLIVTGNENETDAVFYIEKDDMELFRPLNLEIGIYETSEFEIPQSNNIACFDFEKLEFPLLLRKWQQGEYFKPLGMSGFKKVSDFFIDLKLSIPEKENTWILYSGNKIAWILGLRIDDRFKITSESRKVYQITII